MKSLLRGATWAHGARTDEEWARKQADNIRALRARYGRDVKVYIATTSRVAYVNDGRWVLDCTCGGGVIVDLEIMSARCHECGAVYTRKTITLPNASEIHNIEAYLIASYPNDSVLRDWRPGQTIADLAGRHRSWTTPRTWVTGELVTASIGNTHWRDQFNELRPGGIAIASQAADDFILASSATQLTRQGSADIKLWMEVFT